MLGQYRQCLFCRKRFRLLNDKGFLNSNRYNFVTLQRKDDSSYDYAHKKCYSSFIKSKAKERIAELKTGFNIKHGIFLEASLTEK